MNVVVELRGGLGNQLFQYAAGYSLSTRLGAPLALDLALLPSATVQIGDVRRWPEQISSFHHEGEIVNSVGSGAARRRVRQARGTAERLIGDSPIRRVLGRRLYAREAKEDVAVLRNAAGNIRINAYCNSPLYFDDVADEVTEQVRNLVSPSTWYSAESAKISQEQPVALHLRWGDYLNLKHVYGEIPASYYRRALEFMGTSRPIWLFSDDPVGALSFLEGEVQIDHLVESPPESRPLETLLLLSEARAIVAANSSFSWWAAFLRDRALGDVVFPRPLFGPAGPPEPKDWLLDDWTQIGRG